MLETKKVTIDWTEIKDRQAVARQMEIIADTDGKSRRLDLFAHGSLYNPEVSLRGSDIIIRQTSIINLLPLTTYRTLEPNALRLELIRRHTISPITTTLTEIGGDMVFTRIRLNSAVNDVQIKFKDKEHRAAEVTIRRQYIK